MIAVVKRSILASLEWCCVYLTVPASTSQSLKRNRAGILLDGRTQNACGRHNDSECDQP